MGIECTVSGVDISKGAVSRAVLSTSTGMVEIHYEPPIPINPGERVFLHIRNGQILGIDIEDAPEPKRTLWQKFINYFTN